MTVSPEIAGEWLKKSKTHNRRIRPDVVRQLAADMAAGAYRMNGETIILDTAGNVLDGHHRLHACVRAGVSFETLVVTGVDPKAMPTIDSGHSRNRADLLTFAGEVNAAKLATAAKLVWLAEAGRLADLVKGNVILGLTQSVHLDVVARHPGLRAAVLTAIGMRRRFPLLSDATYGFLAYWLPRYDRELAESFLENLLAGVGLEKTDPAQLLRQRLIQNAAAKAKLPPVEVLALVAKAWRSHATGTPVKILKWSRDGATAEPFPDFDPMA